jgi:predicted dehydrogenase
MHAEQAIAAARSGKHVLIEKPMASTVADCDAILDACQAAGVSSSIAFSQRTRKCNIKARQLIGAGAIGRILQMEETCLVASGLAGLPKWQSDPENLGTLFGHAIHNFDRVRWFTGEEIKTVYAKCGSLEPDVRVEGTSMVLMTLTDATVVSLWSSFQVPKPAFPRAQFSARIIGEKGLIDLDAYGELRVAIGGEWKVVETQAPIDWQGKGFLDPVRLESYTLQCQDFIDAVLDGRPPQVVGWDGRQAVAAALAAYRSSETATEITLSS